MSHPVFLSSSTLPRMPQGSLNEWRDFFGHGRELEANAFFPLFWRALFSEDDIRHARFIDEHDIDDESCAIEREECLEDFGADATYPYLVTDKPSALARLASRREKIVATIGERYRPIYEGFEALIAQGGFADHLLLRTSGLPDAADAEQWLRADLAALDKLDGKGALTDLATDLSRYDADPVWLLSGNGASDRWSWPTPELGTLFSLPQKKPRPQFNGQEAGKREGAPPPPRKARPAGWQDSALEWLAAVLAAGAALGAYVFTQSVWLAVLAFLCIAVGLGFALTKLRAPGS
ncbi:hypothetical protein [Variovorax sp. PAMC26660]|uniref:hypothetical protein n=1 Tax=Variovorax sp. PAMC26660 TaxID=2762322 RepID=UPI00164D9A3A|nr:hypothetical protein [Variovorax sp. PAMC26660]QNK66647.1 hypothetical protein H7F35_26205 [Variovorax sp. PAMC26660]